MIHDGAVDFLEVAPARVEAAAHHLFGYVVAALTHAISDTSHRYVGSGKLRKDNRTK